MRVRVALACWASLFPSLTSTPSLLAQASIADSAKRLSEQADSLSQQGSASSLRRALELKAQALPLYRRLGDRAGESGMLNDMGELYSLVGKTDSALSHFGLALAIRRGTRDRRGEGETLHEMGALYAGRGMADSALGYLHQALLAERETGDRQLEGETVNSIGYAHRLLGRLDSALTYYAAALRINREIGNQQTVGAILNNIGRVYSLLDRPDSALGHYRQSLVIRRATGDRRGEAITLNNMAIVYQDTGRRDSALSYLRLALPIRREVGDRRGEAVTLGVLANTFAGVRIWDSALAYYRLELALDREVGNRGEQGRTLAAIGLALKEVGESDSARWYLQQSLAIRRENRDRMGEGFGLENLASLYRAGLAQNLGLAVTYYDSAAAVLDAVTRSTGGELNRLNWAEKVLLTLPDWTLSWLGRATEVGPETATLAALAVAERGRAQALLELMRDSSTAFAPGADFPREGRRLATGVAGTGSAAIVYMITRDTLLAWVIRPDSAVETVRVPIAYDSLVASIGAVRHIIGAGQSTRLVTRGGPLESNRSPREDREQPKPSSWSSAAASLASVLLPPRVLELLAGAREVVIVPHWSLALVPFAALPVGPSGELFGASLAVRYAPSLAILELAEARSRVTTLKQALVVGNPAMPQVVAASGERGTLEPLPGAEVEAQAIAVRLAVRPLTGLGASETEIRRRLNGAPVVHLATHAFAYSTEVRARSSFVALAPDSTHDGSLTVAEILDAPDLKLTADLVVLSACDTGLGDLRQAEGTIGLQRAFLAKGARSVLVSLWSVSDVVTAALMNRFYTHWLDDADNPSKAEALRRAQEDIRNRPGWGHPRFWAAFQLVGAR